MVQWRRILVGGCVLQLVLVNPVLAVASDPLMTSSNYSLFENEVGGNGSFDSGSTNFKITPSTDDGGSSLGEAAAGGSSSTNYQLGAGFNSTAQPGLTFVVNTSSVDLGSLSTSVASTATATFSVKNYTSWGYAVTIVGAAPTNSGHALTSLSTDTASAATTEQFGINLRANTSPVSVGADPVQVPGSSFSYGAAGNGSTGTYGTTRPYTIPNNYRYVSGETIASAPKTSGETDYTISFLANISTATPGGKYSGSLILVATGTY